MYQLTVVRKGNVSLNLVKKNRATAFHKEEAERFCSYFLDLCSRIDNLLGGENFLTKNNKAVLSKRLFNLIELWNQQKTDDLNRDCASVQKFIEELELVRDKDRNCFESFKKQLIPQRKGQSWPGLRFEVHVAASLYEKGCNIRKRESPDFEIAHNNNQLFVESTSRRFESASKFSHFNKVKEAIYDKSEKKYANKKTALFIEASNIFFCESQMITPIDLEEFYKSLYMDEKIKYGSIVVFSFRKNNDNKRYESCYRRIEIDGCEPGLKEFLDSLYSNDSFIDTPQSFEHVHTA